MKSVFISYSQRDAEKVAILVNELNKLGLRVFTPNELSVGSDWQASLMSELRKSSLFIAFLSEESSQNVMFELGYALGAAKQVLLVCRSGARIPSDIASLQYISFDESDPSSLSFLIEGIRKKTESVKTYEPQLRDAKSTLERMLNDGEYLEQVSPREFEEVVAEYFKELGFFAEMNRDGIDGGYDMVLTTEPKGRVHAIVQAKKYQAGGILSVSHVRQLVGSMTISGVAGGILVTNARFSPSSHDVAKRSPKPLLLFTIADLVTSSKRAVMNQLAH